ncbi:Uncharacterised protein [uncultured archaeon]|nr:Uncharacterised protein [uncultured archaeon]
MDAIKSFLSRLNGKQTIEVLAKELRSTAKEYDPASYYPINAEEMSPNVVAALEDAKGRKVDIAFNYLVDDKEREKIHAVMLENGLVRKKFEKSHSNLPPIEQILKQSPEPFQYHFKYSERLWFITIDAVQTVKTYDPTKWYRIDSKEMPRELVTIIEATSGSRVAAAERELKGDAADWGVTLPTLATERDKFHAAMRKYGLVKEEYKKWHPDLPLLEQIINQSKEPFKYSLDGGRLWFMEINPVEKAQRCAQVSQ